MNDQRRQERRRRRADRAHSRVRSARWRRLAVEQIESRLMLSGDGLANLDTDTFNLDSFADYAIISNDFAPAVVTAADTPVKQSRIDRISDNGDDSHFAFHDDMPVAFYDLSVASDRGSQLSLIRLDLNAAKNGAFDLLGSAVTGDVAGAKLSIDVAASKLDDRLAPVSMPVTVDPAAIATLPASIGDIRDEPVATPVDAIRSPEAPTLILPIAPTNTFAAIEDSDAQINVGRVIDELLSSDTTVINQSMQYNADDVTQEEVPLTGSAGNSQVEQVLDSLEDNTTALVVNASTDEGGMIPIRKIVGELAQETIAAPYAEQVAAVGASAEISGELARVAVMELLEGEVDPAAPRQASDFTFLVAPDEAAFLPERVALYQADRASATLAAVHAVIDQAALAVSLVAPANPIYFATMLSAASDAFAAASISGPLTTPAVNAVGFENADSADGARSEAFSRWDDDTERSAAAEKNSESTHGLLPIVGVLAVERVVAANRRRKQNAAARTAPDAGPSGQA